ncbi:site-specific integrase, partial [Globicatella sanguinis]|uniref:site-specific integrase n=1 Tax=Globicatella sanguinis TaxID=13076 RepID=UPI0012EED65E
FIKAMNNPQEYIMFRVIAYTGIRKGEMCGLRWSDFDELNGTLSIRRTVARGKDFKKIIQTPKTVSGERTIPLDDETIKDLKEWRNIQREVMILHGYNTNSPEQYIITNESNEFQYSAYPYVVLKKVRKNFDIDHITVHGLRHTHVFLLLEAGVPVKEVQSRLGHENTDMIFQVYDHVNKQKECEVGDIFADFVVSN